MKFEASEEDTENIGTIVSIKQEPVIIIVTVKVVEINQVFDF